MQGRQEPRVEAVPADGADHPDTEAALELVEAAGIRLDPWQKRVLRKSLRRRGGKWSAFEVGICVPRQNGKNVLLEARELAGLFVLGEELLIHAAHLADTSREAFRRLEEHLEANEWLSREVGHVWRTNGHEAIELKSRQRLRFRTRTKGGGRGFSAQWIGFDEAMIFPEASQAAILPVVSAQDDPQLWYTGSAVDQLTNDDGLVFARLRERGIANNDPSLAWFEWSADAESPDAVTHDLAADPERWAMANPSLGIRITEEYLANELRSLWPGRAFAVERLGVGDWPSGDGALALISAEDWRDCLDAESAAMNPLWFAIDVSPDRARSSVCVSGRRDDRNYHTEVVDNDRGTGWIVPRCAELKERHKPAGFVLDGIGPAASLLEPLADVGIHAEPISTAEHARSCGLFYDGVQQGTIRHLGQRELDAAIRGAATRPLGDAWAWSRKNSAVDITPLVGCTLSLGAVARATAKHSPMIAFV